MTFGQKLRLLRTKNQWTQHDLSKQIGIGQPTIHDYERDSKMPRPDTLIRLSKIFGVTTDYLLGIEGGNQNERLDQMARSNPILGDEAKLNFVKSLSKDEAKAIVGEIKKRFPDQSL